MARKEQTFPSVEAAIQSLPDSFWFYVGGGTPATQWERMTRDELLDMARDDDEMNREDGSPTILDQAAKLIWIDKHSGAVGITDDPTLYEFSTAEVPPADMPDID